MKKGKIIILSLVGLLLLAGIIAFVSKKGGGEQINFQTTEVGPGDIASNITATGTIEPVKTVDVGTQVSGIVTRLYVDYNSVVKRGQIIAELDRTNLQSNLSTAQARLRSAQIDLDYQKKNYARYAELKQKDLVSLSEYDVALENFRKAQEAVRIAQQDVARAKTDLSYATVYSPIDGVVISKSVEEGQTVASAFSTPSIVKIAKDLTDMQCIAKVDEADIGEVREGQRVTFTVDAYPEDVFSGTVKQVRQNPVTTNNVVTYEVVISAPNADLKLKPGLTANITIYTLERTGVKSVPAAALRFTPEASVFGWKYVVKDTTAEHKLWTLKGNVLTAHKVEVGVTDGIRTEIISGMEEGDTVIQGFEIGMKAIPGKKDAKKDAKK
ncbi:MAG: efflux RND transporter periplasmic adaptor subunit [Muribaculaceae bacterium]|nr:efflux RND transporter periplasmic adaptor subunit [Muribaculaceae bacterium]